MGVGLRAVRVMVADAYYFYLTSHHTIILTPLIRNDRHPRPCPPRAARVRAQLPFLGLHPTRPARAPPKGTGPRPSEPREQPPRAAR